MSLMMQEKLFVLHLDPWVHTFFTWVTEWEVLQLYAQLWWLLISRTRFVWLFELWAKLVTTFTEYHFHWKEQLTNSLCGLGCLAETSLQGSEKVTAGKPLTIPVAKDSLQAFTWKLKFWKTCFHSELDNFSIGRFFWCDQW